MNLLEMKDDALLQLWRNCMESVRESKPTAGRARELLLQINEIWKARLDASKSGLYKADSPEIGVLKAVGYQVGASGLRAEMRRRLLDQVMTEVLPFVGSPAYMHEWGLPGSRERYRKLHRVLTIFRSGAQHDPRMEIAEQHWAEDLDYIEKSWQRKVR